MKHCSVLACVFFAIICTITFDHIKCSPSLSTLIWSDEFNYTGLPNPKEWTLLTGGSEQEYYTNSSKNSYVSNNSLVITSLKEQMNGYNYTSGRIRSIRTFRYGYFEMGGILPQGRGVLPSFWLVGKAGNWPLGGEIDVFENLGCLPTRLQAGIHTKAYYYGTGLTMNNATQIVNNNKTYHTYALDWNTNRLKIYVDDNLYFTYAKPSNWTLDTWPFDNDFYIIINNAIGGSWAGMMGIDDSAFPTSYTIDYVRYFPSQN